MLPEVLDFVQLDQLYPNSYLKFSHHPIIWDIDAALIRRVQVQPGQKIALLGAGYGADLEHLGRQGKLKEGVQVFAVDLDPRALDYIRNRFGSNSYSLETLLENIEETSLPDESIDKEICANACHNTALRRFLAESSRTLVHGGELSGSTAYMKGHAYPTKKDHLVWGKIIRLATDGLLEMPEYSGIQIPTSEDLVKYSTNEFLKAVMDEEFGFEVIELSRHMANMNQKCVEAICYYDGFAAGAIPTDEIPLNVRAGALVNAVQPVFKELDIDHVDREWMFFQLRKK